MGIAASLLEILWANPSARGVEPPDSMVDGISHWTFSLATTEFGVLASVGFQEKSELPTGNSIAADI
jgi:hypothetical protein